MNKDYQDYELTAFLLDELDDDRRAEIAEILKNSESARQKLEELQVTMDEVGEALADEPAMALSAEQRRQLHTEFDKTRTPSVAVWRLKRLVPRSRFVRWSTGLAAAASLVVVFFLSWETAKEPVVISPARQQVQQEMARRVEEEVARRYEAMRQLSPPAGAGNQVAPSESILKTGVQTAKDESRHLKGVLPESPRTRESVEADKMAATPKSPQGPTSSLIPAFKGKVTDATGAPLPGASVQVASGKSKPVQTTLTDERGQFAVPRLPPGEYKVQASLSGFKSGEVGPVKVETGKTREVKLELRVGQVAETVNVVASVPVMGVQAASSSRLVGGPGTGGGVAFGTGFTPTPERERFNTESYDYQADNEMTAVSKDPLSTFSIDVDTASYSNVRRFLREGRLPPPDAVRIEEMINYFPYDYEPPRDRTPFAVATEVAQAPWAPDHRLVRIALKGRELPPAERPEANLVFLLDVSGSMQSPVKLPLVKQAMRLLVEKLEASDRVSIVVYAGASGLVLPSTSGSDKQRMLDAIDQLEAGGSTHASAGIQLAYQEALANFKANGINRVILTTDGDFNVGITNQGELVRIVQQQAAKGVYLTALGFGMGNYKDSMLEKLADKGNGNYAYIDSLDEARKVLVEQMGGTLVTIAKDVKIQVEFNPLEVSAYRLIGYENRVMAHQDFDDDRKDAGEIGAGHTVTALYEIVPVGVPVDLPQGEPLKYQRKSPAATPRGELLTVKLRYKLPNEETSRKLDVPVIDSMRVFDQASDDFRFAASVAGFGMILRNSPFKGSATFQSMMQIADTSRQFDPQGYRAEFVRLVGEASRLEGNRER